MIESPWKHESVPESFTVAVFVVDDDWRFRYVDAAASDILQRPADELEGSRVWDAFPEAVDTVFFQEYHRAMEEGIAVRFEAFYDPLNVWVQVYAYPIEDGLTVIFQDITQRKNAERNAERLQARNRAIVQALPDDVYLISESGIIVEVEHGGGEVSPSREAILGRSIDDVFPVRAARLFREAIADVRSSGSMRVLSYRLPRNGTDEPVDDGGGGSSDVKARWMEARIVPVEGDGVLAIVRDVTTQRKLERQVLEVARRERERIGRDLHDGIGSLLSGISMMTRSLARDAEDGRDVSVEQLREISRLAKEGVTQARALSRGLNPIDVEPDRFVASIREMASNTETMTGVRCFLDDPDDIRSLKLEVATQLYWITQEAVNNAARHADCDEIAIGVWVDNDELMVRVRDDGKGLSEASSSGLGQQTMRYRAEVIGASIDISNREPTPMRRAAEDDAVEDAGDVSTHKTGVDVICRLPVLKAIPNDVSGAEEPFGKEATT
jgi:hypothetical protein